MIERERERSFHFLSGQPFFHIMASNIADRIGSDDPVPVIATTLVAYSFSSLLTGEFFCPFE